MNMTDVFEIVRADLGRADSGPYGVTWGPLRVRSGSGIAGNSRAWWIEAPSFPHFEQVGPLRTRRELRRALRAIVHHYVRLLLVAGDALERLERGAQP